MPSPRATSWSSTGLGPAPAIRSIAELARGIGIEENSVETATGFFGRIGGGQAIILPASTQTVDVRGLFHGFKNLLSNLQVSYVVKSARDIGEIGGIRFDAVPGRRRRTPNVTARETTETE